VNLTPQQFASSNNLQKFSIATRSFIFAFILIGGLALNVLGGKRCMGGVNWEPLPWDLRKIVGETF